jgi:hypothetical protein
LEDVVMRDGLARLWRSSIGFGRLLNLADYVEVAGAQCGIEIKTGFGNDPRISSI